MKQINPFESAARTSVGGSAVGAIRGVGGAQAVRAVLGLIGERLLSTLARCSDGVANFLRNRCFFYM